MNKIILFSWNILTLIMYGYAWDKLLEQSPYKGNIFLLIFIIIGFCYFLISIIVINKNEVKQNDKEN